MSSFHSELPISFSVESFYTLLARYQAMKAQIVNLNDEVEACKKERATALEEVARVNAILQENKQEITDLRSDLEAADGYGKAKREEQKTLEAKIAELQRYQDLREPLFQVGVSIRVRYLEMAKKLVLKSARGEIDHGSIRRGNAAAHNAMGEVDAVLFQGEILSNKMKDNITKPFADLYKSSPEGYGSLSRKMLQVIDCEATIRTLNVTNDGNRPLAQRQQVFEQIEILNKKYAKLSKESFEADEDVNWRVARVISLTAEIVEEDRQNRAER